MESGAPYLKVSLSKWGQTVAKVKLKRSQSVDILTLATVWPLYPDLSLCLALLSTVYSQFIQAYPHIIITLYAVTHVSYHTSYFTLACPIPSGAAPPLPSVWYSHYSAISHAPNLAKAVCLPAIFHYTLLPSTAQLLKKFKYDCKPRSDQYHLSQCVLIC